jgi:16S rRNA (adenine1518-N6/adenine1519-N6)-dimethyltransferase
MKQQNTDRDQNKKRWKFGQNFLVDEGVIREITDDVLCGKQDWIVEIGPGQGALTRRLGPRCRRLTALEIDPKWVDHLQNRPEWGDLEVIRTDAAKVDLGQLLELQAPSPGNKPLVVGNLPYNRAAPILFHFLPFIGRFQSMNIMVQYEVAKRICAQPHSRDFGFLTVFIRNYAEPELLRKISPDAFRPRPKVFSATVRLVPLQRPHTEDPRFLRFVEAAFSQKRKKLVNSLKPFYSRDSVEEALKILEAGENARAEDLSVEQFVKAFKILGPAPESIPVRHDKPRSSSEIIPAS